MATDTVKVAGKPVNKKVLYGGGLVALGVVAYAWYSSAAGGTGTVEREEELPEPVPEPTDTPGFEVTGGGPRPTTNDEWNAKAVQALLNIGYDAIAVQNAIGKFLQRRPLNLVEAQLVEAAVAAAGYPPENPPWVIIRETPATVPPTPKPGPTPTPTPTPTPVAKPGPVFGLNITKTGRSTFDINFVPTAEMTSFKYRRISGGKGSAWSGPYSRSIIIRGGKYNGIAQIKARALFAKRTTFTVGVIAANKAGYGTEARSRNAITLP